MQAAHLDEIDVGLPDALAQGLLASLVGGRERRPEGGEQPIQRELDRGEEEVLLRAEQPHHVGLADAGRPCHLVGGRALVAARAEDRERGQDDLRTPLDGREPPARLVGDAGIGGRCGSHAERLSANDLTL